MKKSFLMCLLLSLLVVQGFAGKGDKKCEPAKWFSGTYSSLYYNEEGGDLLGMEIRIVPASGTDNYEGTFQFVQGGWHPQARW